MIIKKIDNKINKRLTKIPKKSKEEKERERESAVERTELSSLFNKRACSGKVNDKIK